MCLLEIGTLHIFDKCLLLIHGMENVPLAFGLLPEKRQATYCLRLKGA